MVLAISLSMLAACGSSATEEPPAEPTSAPEATSAPSGSSSSAAPTAAPQASTGSSSGGDTPTPTPYAFAARAIIEELDQKYPWPPQAPPWPPRRGGVAHLTMSPIPDLDPNRARNNENLAQYDALLEWESTWWFPEVHTTPTIRPNIVSSWEAVDLDSWDFHIDPRCQIPRHRADERQYTATASVESVEVIDDDTARFHLKQALANFPPLYTNGSTPPVVAREAHEMEGGLHENPGGTGAFLLKEFSAGEGMLFTATDDYHLDLMGEPLPFLDAVRYVFTRDPATQVALYRAEQIDLLRISSFDILDQVLKSVPDSQLYRIPSFGWGDHGVFLNLAKEPFNDVNVRRAMSMAINRNVIANVINAGDATPYGPIPWAVGGFTEISDYNVDNLGEWYQYNPDRAKQLLADAGYGDGFEVEIEWGELSGFTFGDTAVLLERMWEDIGLDVTIKQSEYATWWSKTKCGEPMNDSLIGLSPYGSGPTAYDWLYLPYHSSSSVNCPHIQDDNIDTLLDEWIGADEARQLEIQSELWDYLTDQVYRLTTIVPPHYRLTQSYMHAGDNPYCWFTGYCSYEVKSAWLTDGAPERSFDKFAE
ncbi:Heme-binding protein A [Geodia barretti]|uniref:Heme-binding protein A n=1 Tax=Geodia barretti TaxID=519541 RepID=A0AA35WL82_GEOBA|nr:Heme-binding protein A [Geodia barretti]